MGAWDYGVFDSDNAKDYTSDVVDSYIEEIDSLLNDILDESSYRESNEAILVLVTFVEVICQKSGCAPPELGKVIGWCDNYIEAFDLYGQNSWPNQVDFDTRKKSIKRCFDSLIKDSKEFWDEI